MPLAAAPPPLADRTRRGACDPAALARNADHLVTVGYHLRRAVPLDPFPMTHHVEVLATFEPAPV